MRRRFEAGLIPPRHRQRADAATADAVREGGGLVVLARQGGEPVGREGAVLVGDAARAPMIREADDGASPVRLLEGLGWVLDSGGSYGG